MSGSLKPKTLLKCPLPTWAWGILPSVPTPFTKSMSPKWLGECLEITSKNLLSAMQQQPWYCGRHAPCTFFGTAWGWFSVHGISMPSHTKVLSIRFMTCRVLFQNKAPWEKTPSPNPAMPCQAKTASCSPRSLLHMPGWKIRAGNSLFKKNRSPVMPKPKVKKQCFLIVIIWRVVGCVVKRFQMQNAQKGTEQYKPNKLWFRHLSSRSLIQLPQLMRIQVGPCNPTFVAALGHWDAQQQQNHMCQGKGHRYKDFVARAEARWF